MPSPTRDISVQGETAELGKADRLKLVIAQTERLKRDPKLSGYMPEFDKALTSLRAELSDEQALSLASAEGQP